MIWVSLWSESLQISHAVLHVSVYNAFFSRFIVISNKGCSVSVNAITQACLVFNTRTGGGGAKNAHPFGFSRIAEKRRRAAPPLFQYLLTIEFYTLYKNFNPRSPKVRSPGQVKVKNGSLTLRLRNGHTRYLIGFKPSAFHKVIDTYNLYISVISVTRGQVNFVTPPLCQWAKIQIVPIEWLCVRTTYILHNHVLLGYSLCSKCKILLRSPGSPGSPWPIDALKANFEVDLTESKLISFALSGREKRNGAKIIAVTWLEKSYSRKTILLKNCVFLPTLMTCVA